MKKMTNDNRHLSLFAPSYLNFQLGFLDFSLPSILTDELNE